MKNKGERIVKKAGELVKQGKLPVAYLAGLKEKFPEIAEKQMLETAVRLMDEKRYKEAAGIYCQLNMAKEAGNAFRQAGELVKAAEWYEKAGMEVEAARQFFEIGAIWRMEKVAKVFFDNKLNRELVDCVHAVTATLKREDFSGYRVLKNVFELCIEAGLERELINELKEERIIQKVLLAHAYLALGDMENTVKMIEDVGRAWTPKGNGLRIFIREQIAEICILAGYYKHLLEFARKTPDSDEKQRRYAEILRVLHVANELQKDERPDHIPEGFRCLERPEVCERFLGAVGDLEEAYLILYAEMAETCIKLGKYWDGQPRYEVHYQCIGMQTTPGRKWRTPTGAGGNAKAWYLQAAKYLIKAGNFKEAEKLMDERYFHEEDLMIELAGAYEDKGMLNEAGETFLKYRSIRAGKKEETDALAEAKRLFTGAENKDGLKKVAEGYTGYGKWEEAVRIYFAIGEMPAARKTALLAAKHFIERGEGHYFNEKFEMVDNLLTKTGATPDQRADFHRELISAIEKRRDNLTKFRELCTVYERLFGLMKKERIDGPETEAQVREKLLELYMNMGETEKAMEVIG